MAAKDTLRNMNIEEPKAPTTYPPALGNSYNAVTELELQVRKQQHTINELADYMKKKKSEDAAFSDLRNELLESQKLLGELTDQTAQTLESLKIEVVALSSDLQQLKEDVIAKLSTPSSSSSRRKKVMPAKGSTDTIPAKPNNGDDRNTPQMPLSSIPPNPIKDHLALELLLAIDEITDQTLTQSFHKNSLKDTTPPPQKRPDYYPAYSSKK